MKLFSIVFLVFLVAGCSSSTAPAVSLDEGLQPVDSGALVDPPQDSGSAADTSIVDIQQDVQSDTGTGDMDIAQGDPDLSLEDIEELTPECAPCAVSEATADFSMTLESLVLAPERTRHNPLKGFITSYLWGEPANDFPDQMEFLYLPMFELWGPEGERFDTGLEPLIEAAAARGHHVVLRVYIDYPNKPYGLPPHLAGEVPCQNYSEHGGGCSPDYDHPLLVEAMVGLINALGAHYDGDPRLGVFQIGLLGFWGEWHTYPHTSWFPSGATQVAVLEAAHNAFSTTLLQVRRPAANSLDLRIGFHDDSFAHSTLGDVDWFFLPSLVAAGGGERWKEVMIGGELRPELQSNCFEDGYTLDTYAQDVGQCINETHASYLLNYKAFNEDGVGYQGLERTRAEAAAVQMGYQFELESAVLSLANMELDENTVEARVTVKLKQTGVAPFYHDLNLSLHGSDGAQLATNPDNLKTLLPGDARSLDFDLGRIAVEQANAAMELHLTSPVLLPGQKILLATTTAQTEEGGETRISWDTGCDLGGEVVPLGAQAGLAGPDCSCICDVDGLMRTCDGSLCP